MEYNQPPQSSIWEENPKLKSLLVGLIFTFLISGIGLVVYDVWSNQVDQKISEDAVTAIPKHKTETWMVYKNSDYGFELSYPKSWGISETDTGGVVLSPSAPYAQNGDYEMQIEPKIASSSALDGREDLVCPTTSEVKISGLGSAFCKSQELGMVTYYYRVKDLNNTLWQKGNLITFSIPNVHAELLPTYEKILGSLKITNPKTATELKVYHSENLGFDIQYPSTWEVSVDVMKIRHSFTVKQTGTNNYFVFGAEENPGNKMGITDWIKTGFEDGDNVMAEEIRFNDYLAYKLSSKNSDIDGNILIFHNNSVFTFPKPDDLNRNILSTFQFSK